MTPPCELLGQPLSLQRVVPHQRVALLGHPRRNRYRTLFILEQRDPRLMSLPTPNSSWLTMESPTRPRTKQEKLPLRDPTVPSAPATLARSNSGSHHSRPLSITSSTKRRRRTPSKSKPRKSEESFQEFRDGGLNPALNFQQAQVPFFHPSEGRDTTIFKTPTRSTSSTTAVKPTPLLPPIELQPPSPPCTATKSHPKTAYTTNEIVEGLELETLGAGAVGVGSILPVPPVSPNKLSPGKPTLQSQKSVSLGRSTTVNGSGDEYTGLSFAGGINGGEAGGGLPRRNSLGDLKVPARISQAQGGLRRDLGMVGEFASKVEREFSLAYSGLLSDYNIFESQN